RSARVAAAPSGKAGSRSRSWRCVCSGGGGGERANNSEGRTTDCMPESPLNAYSKRADRSGLSRPRSVDLGEPLSVCEEVLNAAGNRRSDLGLVSLGGQQPLFLGMREEGGLDEDGRHPHAEQHVEEGFLGAEVHDVPLFGPKLANQALLHARCQSG